MSDIIRGRVLDIVGLGAATRYLENAARQIPFALSKAINETLKETQKYTLARILPKAFTLRARGKGWWTPGNRMGFNIKFSNKRNLEGRLGSAADWLRDQEQGGVRRKPSGARAIPTLEFKPLRELLPASRRPRKIAQAIRNGARRSAVGRLGGVPFIPGRASTLPPGIYVRTKDGQTKSLFWFEKAARIRPVLNFESQAEKYALAKFPGHFKRAYDHALATSK